MPHSEAIAAAVLRARSVLAGAEASPAETLQLVETLHQDRQFGLARRMLEKLARRDDFLRLLNADPLLELAFAHQRSMSTYKDPDLPTDLKNTRALEILQAADPLDSSVDCETLGQAGSVYKNLWLHGGRERHLETSLAFYLRGCEQGVARDFGYTAINAAFVLDVLADLESPDLQPASGGQRAAEQRREQASSLRKQIVRDLGSWPQTPENEWRDKAWWYLVTLGEACFGLGDYDAADGWLSRAAALPDVPDWKREGSARQLATLWRIQQRLRKLRGVPADPRGEAVLSHFLGDARQAWESVVRGKVGLALSGGGFRASLFHIGVLARLAELDLLRHVECMSCVSGGSIIGAHYYLEVRQLLQSKADRDITREDYIGIVEKVADDFLAGVQRNIRTRVGAELTTNLRMIFMPDYSRTMRAGDLYEREIFARVQDGEGGDKRWLNELKIKPKDAPGDFRPKEHNWRRAAKVPILVLNATSLNTGHNWQFTASWMGEPPADIDSEVDANYRLRRLYYSDAPRRWQGMRLGHAVAASSCVPGLFEPLALSDLYERAPGRNEARVRPVVRLVDGGVHDNQGTSALLEQGCSVLLVSDASGQMGDQDNPSSGLLGVPLRSNSILQARVRSAQFRDLASRRRGGMLKGLMFVHLKKGLDNPPVDWVGTQDPSDPPRQDPLLGYGIQRDIQRRLAAVRTDLDSFSDAEGWSLMASGYLMTKSALGQPILGFDLEPATPHAWKFQQVLPMLADPDPQSWLRRQLKVADKLALKVWLVTRRLQIGLGIAGVVLLSFLAYQLLRNWQQVGEFWQRPLFELRPSSVGWSVGIALLSFIGLGTLSKVLNYRKTVQQVLIGIGMALAGFVLARLHLHVFDKLFLWQGRLKRRR